MRLLFDAGNTTLSYALYNDDLIDPARIRSNDIKTSEDIEKLIDEANEKSGGTLEDIVVCAGVSRIRALIYEYAHSNRIPVHFVYGSNLCGAKINYETLETIGPDRIANSIAAEKIYKNNVIVIDCGTAITIDAIDSKGVFVGGIIAPGLYTQRDALTHYAPALPEVELNVPRDILGTNTIDCIKSGVLYGASSMIDTMVRKIAQKNGFDKFVLTGGNANLIKDLLELEVIYDEYFTLRGLALAELNS